MSMKWADGGDGLGEEIVFLSGSFWCRGLSSSYQREAVWTLCVQCEGSAVMCLLVSLLAVVLGLPVWWSLLIGHLQRFSLFYLQQTWSALLIFQNISGISSLFTCSYNSHRYFIYFFIPHTEHDISSVNLSHLQTAFLMTLCWNTGRSSCSDLNLPCFWLSVLLSVLLVRPERDPELEIYFTKREFNCAVFWFANLAPWEVC